MNWTPDEKLVAKARENGLLVQAGLPEQPWFDVETRDGRWLAEAQGWDAARLAARTQIDDGETEVYVVAPDGERVVRFYLAGGYQGGGRDGTTIAWEYGDSVRKWDGRAA